MKEKTNKTSQLCFRVTEEEHNQLKVLAAKERKTLKQLFFTSLDKKHPNWRNQE